MKKKRTVFYGNSDEKFNRDAERILRKDNRKTKKLLDDIELTMGINPNYFD